MLTRLANAGIRSPRRGALLALLFVIVAGALGGPAAGLLKARNDFEDPGSQAADARKQIERVTGAEPSAGVLLLVKAPGRSRAAASAAATLSRDPDLTRVTTYAQTHDPSLVARDGRSTLIAATLRSGVESNDAVNRLEGRLAGRHDVVLGGAAVAFSQVGKQASQDLGLAELLAAPLLALLAILIFRGIAAVLPLLVGLASVLGAFTLLRLINAEFQLSVFATNLVIGLGLGLAVDYSLFVVSRFREELGRGAEPPAALRTTMTTAGRTVIFSSLTVACATASLVVFPLRFLQSMGIGGAVVALVAAGVSLVFLPPLMILLGPRIGRHTPGPEHEGRWYRVAHAVMRHPGIVAATTAAAMILLTIPAVGARWTGVDASILPPSKSARVVSDTLTREFPLTNSSPLVIALHAPSGAGAEVAAYAHRVSGIAGVTGVGAPRYVGAGTWQIDARTQGKPIDPPAQRVVAQVRALGAPASVGGEAAQFHDQLAAIAASLPVALVILAGTTLVILWVMTGSVVLPVKALLMNALTVGAATGLLVLIFQDGRLTGPLAYTSQGGIEVTDFLVLAALAFALSTDYGVFLLTRIKEARDSGLDDREAVATGLERSGRIVTAAALLLAVAIGAFATSKVVFLKEIGLGAATAVLLDAFVVRTLLVPSLMALLGHWNWWSPAPLARLHRRIGINESGRATREVATSTR